MRLNRCPLNYISSCSTIGECWEKCLALKSIFQVRVNGDDIIHQSLSLCERPRGGLFGLLVLTNKYRKYIEKEKKKKKHRLKHKLKNKNNAQLFQYRPIGERNRLHLMTRSNSWGGREFESKYVNFFPASLTLLNDWPSLNIYEILYLIICELLHKKKKNSNHRTIMRVKLLISKTKIWQVFFEFFFAKKQANFILCINW